MVTAWGQEMLTSRVARQRTQKDKGLRVRGGLHSAKGLARIKRGEH
jgi:hypothetical protein